MKHKNNDLNSYMFRYLEKYTGKYRVLPYYDVQSLDFPRDATGSIDDSFDDLYIPCKKGVIKHTYDDYDKLAFCMYDKRPSVAKAIYDEIFKKYPFIEITLVENGSDSYIYFYDKDINKISSIIKPKTSGAKIKWTDNRNLPKVGYIIPEEDSKKLIKATEKIPKNRKMVFMKSCNSEFLDKHNIKSEVKTSRLSAKEYIHKNNLWDDYIKFVKNKVKEV